MNPKIIETLETSKVGIYAERALEFIRTGDEIHLPPVPYPRVYPPLNPIWTLLAREPFWQEEEIRLARLAVDSAVRFKGVADTDWALQLLLGEITKDWNESRIPVEEILVDMFQSHGVDAVTAGHIVHEEYLRYRTWGLGEDSDERTDPELISPLERMIFDAADADLAVLLWKAGERSRFTELVARFRPHVIGIWWSLKNKQNDYYATSKWVKMLPHTARFDSECLQYANLNASPPNRFILLQTLHACRGGYGEQVTEAAKNPQALGLLPAIDWLLEMAPDEVIGCMVEAVKSKKFKSYRDIHFDKETFQRFMNHAACRWSLDGQSFFESLRDGQCEGFELNALGYLLKNVPPSASRASAAVATLDGRSADETGTLWDALAVWIKEHPISDAETEIFKSAFWRLLGSSSSKLRSHGANLLTAAGGYELAANANSLLSAGKADQKLGAIALLQMIGDASAKDILSAALTTEKSEKVRAGIHQALKFCGTSATNEPGPSSETSLTGPELERVFAEEGKKIKMPPSTWLKPMELPPISYMDGSTLSQNAIAFLIFKQSKYKTIDVSPDVLPLLDQMDRKTSAPFASALVEGFLNSEQAAADRWALALGGLLGDNRIITLLLPRINDWCENSRHKLAEYAAQTISLLPGNEPLMVLDTLSNRYRSKFKNVGKACAEAFNAAAAVRGITTDELGDLVVPDFGFDSEGVRRFDWEGGGVSAELGADFKLTWFDPETDKTWKTLPANAPEAIKTEVKTLGKLLRETVKGQTARLEMTLVRQRRWSVARWRELFENHPLLRSFASSLVWGVYDNTGVLLRTFRRYPNGLLADAAGTLDELPETDTMIGMVHPLELDAASLVAWRAHLSRFKVKAPFPQIDRPVELLDPLHGNRREISVTKEKKLSAGTFRSRAEKRGWTRGSVVDAGGISSYYKLYPGAGVEVILPTNDFWVGCDPMDTLELGAAYFVKAESVERGSYIYNEPSPDDPRVMRFDQVPAVVWSETLSDLKAIVATKE